MMQKVLAFMFAVYRCSLDSCNCGSCQSPSKSLLSGMFSTPIIHLTLLKGRDKGWGPALCPSPLLQPAINVAETFSNEAGWSSADCQSKWVFCTCVKFWLSLTEIPSNGMPYRQNSAFGIIACHHSELRLKTEKLVLIGHGIVWVSQPTGAGWTFFSSPWFCKKEGN